MKKLILISILSLLSTVAFANPPNGVSYNVFKSIKVDSFVSSPICPKDLDCTHNGTIVDFNYKVPCNEDVISFTYTAKQISNEIHVFISAITGSLKTNGPVCQAFNTYEDSITLVNMHGKIVVHDLVPAHQLEDLQ